MPPIGHTIYFQYLEFLIILNPIPSQPTYLTHLPLTNRIIQKIQTRNHPKQQPLQDPWLPDHLVQIQIKPRFLYRFRPHQLQSPARLNSQR